MQCMHSNGIAFDIIKKKLPIINEEIAKTIANIVDFNIFFEVDGNKIEIYIKHPKHDARPLRWVQVQKKQLLQWQFVWHS